MGQANEQRSKSGGGNRYKRAHFFIIQCVVGVAVDAAPTLLLER